jgi:hypothetical protein
MSYRVWIGTTAIECETPEDALELARRAEGTAGDSPARKSPSTKESEHGVSRWTEKRVAEFFRLIDGNQRKLIDALLEHSDGRTDQQLVTLFGYGDGKALGGLFGGLWKNAKKAGADPDDLYVKQRTMIGGRKAHEYLLSDSFRRAAQAHRSADE